MLRVIPLSSTRIAVTLALLTVLAGAGGPAEPNRGGRLAPDAVGVIEGRVQLEPLPAPRRQPQRYPGRTVAAHAIQELPAVVYLVGPLPGASAPDQSMTQRDTTFVPSVVFVPVGGAVSFPNQDPFQHNVYSYSRARDFDLGRQNPGSSASQTFETTGIVEVFCEVHEFMRGAIIVAENPYHALVGVDGSYRITGVPEGEHTLAFWHPDHEPVERTVVVTTGGTSVVDVQLQR